MEMNQFYNSGAVQHSGSYNQQYPAYNSWASECVKYAQNYNNNSVMFGDNFNNCLDQSNDFCQYNPVPQSNNMSQEPAVPLQNQNPVLPNKTNMQKSVSEDSPALRALLTNPVKKIKYNPNYYSSITQPSSKSDEYKISQIKEALTSVEGPTKSTTASTRKQLTPILDSAVLSPQSSEPEYHPEYLNYTSISQSIPKDGFTSPTMSTTPSVLSEITAGSPFEISPPPSASSVASTISNSPPPSPIGQKFALSSQNMTPSSWLPNGSGPQAPMNNLAQQLWMSNKDADSYLGEEKQGSKRSRQTYSRSQTHMLELSFFKSTYLSRQRRSELSKELSLTERQVKIWFQNRRMKEKKVKGTPAEKKSPPQPQQFMAQPPLGYVTKSPGSTTTTAVTAPYQPPAGYQAHHNSLGVPRPPISHNMSGQSGFNMIPSAPIPGQFMPPSYDAFSKRNTLPTGMEHHFPQQPFGANQYPQFPYPHQNSHNYLAPTCNYGQYPIRTSNMTSSTDFPMVAPNVFAG